MIPWLTGKFSMKLSTMKYDSELLQLNILLENIKECL